MRRYGVGMRGSVWVGFGIAALFAAGVIVVAVFGNHQSWFVRAARENAVRCLTASPCVRIAAKSLPGIKAPPPLTAASPCAKPNAWREVKAVSNGQTKIVITCVDGKVYLYHMGKLADPRDGDEQWMVCSEPTCDGEINDLTKRMR